jgi:hypothetical protein
MINIYAFSGKLGTGKDYLARKFIKINDLHNYAYVCFSDIIKLNTIVFDKIDFDRVFVAKDEESRSLLQRNGTENGRNKYGEDVWIRYMHNSIRMHAMRGIKNVIITDLRFKNEYEYLNALGAVIFRIEAPQRHRDKVIEEFGTDRVMTHSSETDLDDVKFEKTIRNDYNEDQESIETILKLT